MSALGQKIHMVGKVGAAKNGARVTFTLSDPGTYSDTTGTWSGGSTVTMAGTAQRVAGDPERYKALELVESESPTLSFTPDTYGDVPRQGMSVLFGGLTYLVSDIEPKGADGTASSVRVVVTR